MSNRTRKFDIRKLKSKRKFDRGRTPCGACDGSRHEVCRPRLDNTLCSCACPRSVEWRETTEACGGNVERAKEHMYIQTPPHWSNRPPSIDKYAPIVEHKIIT